MMPHNNFEHCGGLYIIIFYFWELSQLVKKRNKVETCKHSKEKDLRINRYFILLFILGPNIFGIPFLFKPKPLPLKKSNPILHSLCCKKDLNLNVPNLCQ
jgi:hypothetical protein